MKARLFVSTAAAALIAGATFAAAQSGGTGSGGGGSGSGAAGGAGASQGGGESSASGGMGSGGSGGSSTMDRGSATPSQDRVQDDKAAPSKRIGQSPSGSDRNQAQSPRGSDRDQAQGERSGQRDRAGQRDGQRDGERTGQRDRDGQGGRQSDRARENTGSAPSNANVTGEQRTQIRERLGSRREARVTNVNFNVSVGVRVPRSVRLYTLPDPIVEIVPAYRGYKYVIVGDEIIIIHPRTLEIVMVIDA